MISKVCARGRGVQGLLYYLFTEGQAGQKQLSSDHHEPRVVGGFDPPQYLQPGRTPDGRRDFRHLVQMLTQPLFAAHSTPDHRPVYHLVAAAAKDPQTGQLRDRLLTDAEWGDIAEEYMHRLGLARRDDDLGVRWIAVRHADDHVHIIATLATLDGRRVHPHNDFYKARAASHAIERKYGLNSTAPADHTAAKRPTRSEIEKLARVQRQRAAEGRPVPKLTDRETLSTSRTEAAQATSSPSARAARPPALVPTSPSTGPEPRGARSSPPSAVAAVLVVLDLDLAGPTRRRLAHSTAEGLDSTVDC